MKSLKTRTAKKYTTKQLYRHLDRLMTKFDDECYRIDYQYGRVSIWSEKDRCYRGWSGMDNWESDSALEAIYAFYEKHNIENDWSDRDGPLEHVGCRSHLTQDIVIDGYKY